jgi:hypothetical protein
MFTDLRFCTGEVHHPGPVPVNLVNLLQPRRTTRPRSAAPLHGWTSATCGWAEPVMVRGDPGGFASQQPLAPQEQVVDGPLGTIASPGWTGACLEPSPSPPKE